MKLKMITDQIIHLEFPDQKSLTTSLCRIQEFYESPQFKGEIFTLGQYREWYSQQFGAWTYYEDWNGFNLPEDAFQPFILGLFDPLSPEEHRVVELVRYKATGFYVIATHEQSEEEGVLEHEISHAMYNLNPTYRSEVKNKLQNHDLSDLCSHLMKLGYAGSVLQDECHAYIGESSAYLDENKISYPKHLVKHLRAIKKKHMEKI